MTFPDDATQVLFANSSFFVFFLRGVKSIASNII